MEKTLDEKLSKLREDNSCDEFILADAKDADMAFGLSSAGICSQTGKARTISEYRDLTRQIVEQGLIDIALMSVSTCEDLSNGGLFEECRVTPAIRANDTTDTWLAAGTGSYTKQLSLPFRSASLVHVVKSKLATLGLYSITLNNNAIADRESLEAYAEFRREADECGFHHFLEIFPPNAAGNNAPKDVNQFIADSIVRALAGLTLAERPLFLKIPYLGPGLSESLAAYDSSLVMGIMGGSAGTTHDAFALLANAKKHGVRAALFGRRINIAEDQLAFVRYLRLIADGEIEVEDGVRSYHADLDRLGLVPRRMLEEDLELTQSELSVEQNNCPRA